MQLVVLTSHYIVTIADSHSLVNSVLYIKHARCIYAYITVCSN